MATWQQWEGRVIDGRFPLSQYLGGSGHSAVYLTEINGSKAAIKLIPSDAARVRLQVSRLSMAGRLSHPHLVRILETGRWHADEEHDMVFAVMEHVDENLAEVLPNRPLTPAEASAMLIPALDALTYLHGQGMVHGNIKPANIMAVGDQLKLSSDGIRPQGQPEDPIESGNAYAAPENASGTISPKSDIWSLGMILVEALTNRLPAWDKADKNNPQLPENVPQPFDDIARHCLILDPGRRWSAVQIRERLRGQLADVSEDVGKQDGSKVAQVTASASVPKTTAPANKASGTIVERPEAPRKRRGVREAAAIIIIITLGVIAGVRLLQHSSGTPQPASNTSAPPSTAPPVEPAVHVGGEGRGAVAHEAMPDVTQEARNTITGRVTVKVKVAVDPSGKVSQATLLSQGPSRYFANQALQAAHRWTFRAPTVDGKPVPSEWNLMFEFKKSGTKVVPQLTSPAS
jgi:TonB family protein